MEQELHLTNTKLRETSVKLGSLSITTKLTGLHNRRHFNSAFTHKLNRAKGCQSSQAFIMIDIDLFEINDNTDIARAITF